MRLVTRRIHRRTEDAGSAGCPPQAVGCTTNPDGHDLTPAQASSLSQSLAASSASATATATVINSGETVTHGRVNPQAVAGIIVIIILVLAFSMAIGYIVFGSRGERCCCTIRRHKKRRPVVQKEAEAEASSYIDKEDSQARLVQNV